MRIAPVADVKARLSAYLDQCETEGPVVITRNGKAVAVLLAPMNDEDLEGCFWRGPRASRHSSPSRERVFGKEGTLFEGFLEGRRQPKSQEGSSQVALEAPALTLPFRPPTHTPSP